MLKILVIFQNIKDLLKEAISIFREDKFPVPLIYNMTYLSESLILHDSSINSAIFRKQRFCKVVSFTTTKVGCVSGIKVWTY